MRAMEQRATTKEEFDRIARTFAQNLRPVPSSAVIVTLSGEMGAGKTTFVQGIAKEFGVTIPVTSPTFVLEKIYPLTNAPFKTLVHIDAYRLEKGSELEPLRLAPRLSDPATLILLEWPERVADALTSDARAIQITLNADGSRTISYVV